MEARAVHVDEKVGFRRVGILRDEWSANAGRWADGPLMDLLRDDLHDDLT